MITIEQLLESVDLDFEPRFVTKDSDEEDGCICAWDTKPTKKLTYWQKTDSKKDKWAIIGYIKTAEFADKPWQECIYEVPRKTDEQNLEKLRPADSDLVYRVNLPRKTTGKIEKLTGALNGKRKIVFPSDVSQEDIISKLHEVIDAVNELKGEK